ncbi:hypothetical protein EJB05_01570, partial [Eragrostis curvula]
MAGRTSLNWGWNSDTVIAHDGKLWLRGLISCDPFEVNPKLRLDDLPETISEDIRFKSPADEDRIVSVSRSKIRFAELTQVRTEPVEATLMVIWTLVVDPTDGFTWWKKRCETMIGHLWNNDTYIGTMMAKHVPTLALISSNNPDIVFFFLMDQIFSVDVPEGRLLTHFKHTCGPDKLVRQTKTTSADLLALCRRLGASTGPLNQRNLSTAYSCPVYQKPLKLQDETLHLRRCEYALKILREDSLKRLEEGLLVQNTKKDDSSWNKIQILLLGVLVTGITALFSLLPWLPLNFASRIVLSFGIVWSLGCIAVPVVLFASHQWELGIGHHIARAVFMSFSVFILFGLYRMCKYPTPPTPGSLAPAPSDTEVMIWGWIEYAFTGLL